MTSNHHGPYALGYTRATMAGTESSHLVRGSESIKPVTVRIGVCNFDYMKVESLVIVYQNDTVNTFPGLVHTARHITKAGST